MRSAPLVPVVLFAYARPQHLRRTLACLRENNVPLIYAFSDGAKTPDVESRVMAARKVLHEVDWCEIHIVERDENLGLGISILAGVDSVLKKHEMAIIFEDDLICVPGTYQYLSAAMEHYRHAENVMSVTGFTLPIITPPDIVDQPYFDGRTDCLVWGTWARAWKGMETSAETLVQLCVERGIDPYKYGAVLPQLAEQEKKRNTWAVRFTYLHILNGGLCLRPPYSMVEHAGFDQLATNTPVNLWPTPPLTKCPPIPQNWPNPVEHPECARIWQTVDPRRDGNSGIGLVRNVVHAARKTLTTLARSPLIEPLKALRRAILVFCSSRRDRSEFIRKYGNRYRTIAGYGKISGFLTEAQALKLFDLAEALSDDSVVVEIGSWQGKSSLILAKGIQGKSDARLFCIDPFDASGDDASAKFVYIPSLQEFAKEDRGAADPLLRRFERNMRAHHVAHLITILHGYSYEHSASFSCPIDLLFIDGNHDYEAVKRDYTEWCPKLKVGGALVLHDVDFDPYTGPSGIEDQLGPGRVAQECIINSDEWRDISMTDNMLIAVKRPISAGES